MRKSIFAPAAVLAAGVAGALIRRAELSHAFEENGLPKPWAASTVALAVLSAAVFAACIVLAVLTEKKFTTPNGFEASFRTNSYLSFAVMALAGIATMVCAVTLIFEDNILELTGVAKWIFLILMALSGMEMTVMAYTAYTRKGSPLLKLGSLTLSVFYCFWMVTLYRFNAGNPVILDYCYSALAFGAAAVSAYYIAGYAFDRKSLKGTVLSSCVAIYLLTVAAADPAPTALRAAAAATAVFLTFSLVGLMLSLRTKNAES